MNAKKQPGQQLSFFDIPQINAPQLPEIVKPQINAPILYVGEATKLVEQEKARMINFIETTRSKSFRKDRKDLLKVVRSYHPGLMFADNWAEDYDDAKEPVTVEHVRDDILWELTYWQHITENQAVELRQ